MKHVFALFALLLSVNFAHAQCDPVTNIYTSNTTISSTTVGWFVGSASSTSWEIQYGYAGFTLGTGTTVTVTTNPGVITGLSGSTSYGIYVREVCSLTNKSVWTGPVYVTTPCTGAISPPYFENFESPLWEPYVNFQNYGDMSPCWLANPFASFSYQWLVNPNPLFSLNSGPSGDHTTGTGKYVASQAAGGSNTFATLRSPQINLATVSNPELNFWYHLYGSDIASLEVEIKPVASGSWTVIYTKSGQQQTSAGAAWQSASVSLAAYSTQTVYIRFKGTRTGTTFNAKIAIDDLSIVPGSSCPKPAAFAASNITSTTITTNWTGTAGSYEVKHGALGFNPNIAGTSTVVTGLTTTKTGLTQNTVYDFYVRKLCSTDTSNWEGPLTITTLCFASAPFIENFDGPNWVKPVNFSNDIGTISNCWNRTLVQTFVWIPGPGPFASFQTGPSADHTTGTATGKFMFTDSPQFGGVAPITATLTTQQIDLSPLDTAELTFWYHMYGNQIGTLKVEINNGSGWTQIFTKTGQQQTSKTDAWDEATINLSAYVNDTIQLRFIGSKAVNGFNSEIAIDDVNIHELPACPKPTNLAAGAPTFNSVPLTWTTGGANKWLIKYGAPGFTSGTYVSVPANPFTLTGLSANTNYELWLRDSCAVGSVSAWVGPILFTTACSPTLAPYSENFNGTSFVAWTFADQDGSINDCYKRSSVNDFYWVTGPAPFPSIQSGPSSDFSGNGKFMYTRTSNFNADLQTSFSTPWINMSALSAPELRFYYHMFGNTIDKLEVRVQSYNGTIQLLTTLIGQQQASKTAPWIQKVQSLAAVSSDTVRFIFTGHRLATGFNSEIAIDNLQVSNPQNCASPTALAASSITSSSVQLSWTSGVSTASTNIEYGPSGFIPGNGTSIFHVTSPYVVTGLASNTSYQFYIQDSCTWGGLSTRVGPISATTLNCPAVVASFTSAITGLAVSFNASASTGNPTSFAWNFGDGNIGTGTTASHTYLTGGTYNVTLVATSACGATNTFTQTITVCQPLLGQFITTANGLGVTFNGTTSTGTNLTYGWLFGDGNTGTGSTTSHTYAADGTYTISLILTDLCGNADTVIKTLNVCNPAVAVINFTQNGLDVSFDGGASTGAVQWQWFFGDGGTSTSATQLYTYAANGTYLVTLYTTNLCGDRDTATVIVTICNTPKASWTYKILSSNANGMTVQFDGTSSIGANSYVWEFGDGNTNTSSAVPVHTYGVPGLFYIVKLTVSNNCGDQDVFTSSLAAIGLNDLEKAGLTVFPNPVDDFLVLHVPNFLTVLTTAIVSADGKTSTVEESAQGETITLNTGKLAAGTYFLHVTTNAGSAVYQFVVQH